MIPRVLAGLASAMLSIGSPACPEPGDKILFHSCWGDAQARIVLLPEDETGRGSPGFRLTVTGAYTGTEPRASGAPMPVGYFMRDGEVVNRNMSRMDGLLIVGPDGRVDLQDRTEASLGDRTYDLRGIDDRRAFEAAARERGLSILQSHLLIIDGEADVTDQENAPRFRRRLLFTDDDGWGLYQTDGAVTLYDAAMALRREVGPRMALNLDMGSYDLCLREEDGIARNCGILSPGDTAKLSNVIELRLD